MNHPTKNRIIESAESLFARHGYAATSLRDITDAAGANVAAVNYHFGSKEALLIAVLDRTVGPIGPRRTALLDEFETAGEPSIAQVLTAYLLPPLEVIAELRARDTELPRFVSRMYTEGSQLMNQVMGRQFAETQTRFMGALRPLLPDVNDDELLWRLRCVVGVIVYLFADPFPDHPMTSGDAEQDLKRVLNVTIPMVTAGEGVMIA